MALLTEYEPNETAGGNPSCGLIRSLRRLLRGSKQFNTTSHHEYIIFFVRSRFVLNGVLILNITLAQRNTKKKVSW